MTQSPHHAEYRMRQNKEGLYRAVIDKFVFELLSNSLKREEFVSNEKPFLSFIMNELNLTKERMNSVRNTLIDANSTEYINLLSSAKFHYEGFNDRCKALDQEITQGQKILLLVPESGRFSYGTVLLTRV